MGYASMLYENSFQVRIADCGIQQPNFHVSWCPQRHEGFVWLQVCQV
jgi:hypothetical protein